MSSHFIQHYSPEPEPDPLEDLVAIFVSRFPGAQSWPDGAMTVSWSFCGYVSLIMVNGPNRLEAMLVGGAVTDIAVVSDCDEEAELWCQWLEGVL